MEFNKKLTRRDFLKLGATGMVAATLAGCSSATEEPAPEEPSGEDEPVVEDAPPPPEASTIEFLAWGDIVDTPIWAELADMYKERTGVTVNVTGVPDPGGGNFYAKLRTMMAGGVPLMLLLPKAGNGSRSWMMVFWLPWIPISKQRTLQRPTRIFKPSRTAPFEVVRLTWYLCRLV